MTNNSQLSVAQIATSANQVGLELWRDAYSILDDCPAKHRRILVDDESTYILTPNARARTRRIDFNVAVAALVDSKNKWRKIDVKSPLFLVINDNIVSPQIRFHRYSVTTLYTIENDGEINTTEVKEILTFIRNEIKDKAGRAKRQKEQAVRRWRRRGVRIGLPLISLAALICGIVWLTHHVQATNAKNEREERAYAMSYDAKNISIRSEVITLGESMNVKADPAALSVRAPSLDRIQEHPRQVSLESGTCKRIGKISGDKGVTVATDGPADNVIATIDRVGSVSLCALENQYVDDDDTPSYKVLVQLKPAPGS